MTRSRTSSLTRPVTMSLLAVAITAAAAHAQVVVDSQPKVVKGVAPEVTVTVSNTTRADQPPATGDELKANPTITDADGDTIQGITYRWLRGDVEVGDKDTYTATTDDTDQELRVEVVASTDAENTDPASGTGSVAVTIGNAPPVASQGSISGDHIVGSTLTANYTYGDADRDPEGATEFDWCWFNVACGKGSGRTYTLTPQDHGRVMEVYIRPKSLTGSPDTGVQARVVAESAVRYPEIVLGDFQNHVTPSSGLIGYRQTVSGFAGNASAKSKIHFDIAVRAPTGAGTNATLRLFGPGSTNIVWQITCDVGANNGWVWIKPPNEFPTDYSYAWTKCQQQTVEVDLSSYPRSGLWELIIDPYDPVDSYGNNVHVLGGVRIDTN